MIQKRYRGTSESVLHSYLHLLRIITEQEEGITSRRLVNAMEDAGFQIPLRRVQRYMNIFVAAGVVAVAPRDLKKPYDGRIYVKSGRLALTWEYET